MEAKELFLAAVKVIGLLGIQNYERKTKVHHCHGHAGSGKNYSFQEAWGASVDAGHKP